MTRKDMSKVETILAEMQELPDFVGFKKVDVNTRGNFGDTPLHVAAVRGDIDAGKVLLDSGANLNVKGEHGYTPLHMSIEHEKTEFVALLLSNGADKSIKNDFGQTPSEIAAESSNPAIRDLFEKIK